ncbi:WD40 repeat-containing protein HOS15-like [Olea europaea var. sylvestris]|uniref:WD40 repeat-containing protein HOS15-like n=1 Tax=Olea europaea var. sylvestris TaxID=158386 RepID=UPI000C1D0266|nr:WD40 repeat-containing protein HOS15-like [Olea europaea var. sylvestris]
MASMSSVELNYLIFRYLHESGFAHTAFAFGYEAGISKNPIDGNLVPPEALIKFVQKGVQYMDMEANLNNADDEDEDFSLLKPLDLIRKDVNELHKIVKDRKKNQQEAGGKELDRGHEGENMHKEDKDKDGKNMEKQDMEIECGNDKDRVENDSKRLKK